MGLIMLIMAFGEFLAAISLSADLPKPLRYLDRCGFGVGVVITQYPINLDFLPTVMTNSLCGWDNRLRKLPRYVSNGGYFRGIFWKHNATSKCSSRCY